MKESEQEISLNFYSNKSYDVYDCIAFMIIQAQSK